MKTIRCRNCNREHGLFWLVSGPDEKQLSYRCDRVQRLVERNGKPEYHSFTETRVVTDKDVMADPNLPEEYTASYRKAMKDKGQQQFVLMYKS